MAINRKGKATMLWHNSIKHWLNKWGLYYFGTVAGTRSSIFSCKHHTFEIILRSIFDKKLYLSSSRPNVSIFKCFQQAWPQIDMLKFRARTGEPSINEILNTDLKGILDFVKSCLVQLQPGGDYKELLELILIFLWWHSLGG